MAAPVHVQVGADGWVHTTCLHQGGFPSLLWDTLREFGYIEPPNYVGREYIELGLHRCEVVLDIPSTPVHAGWAPWRIVAHGNELTDTWEIAAFEALTKFCEKHQEEIAGTPAAVFPIRVQSDAQLMARVMDLEATIPGTNLLANMGRYSTALFNLCQLRNAEIGLISDMVVRQNVQIQELNHQIDRQKYQRDRKNEQIQELKEKVAKLKEAKLKENEQVQELKEKVAKLKEAKLKENEQVQELKEKVAKLKEAKLKENEQVQELKEKVAKLKEAKLKKNEQVQELKEKVAKLKSIEQIQELKEKAAKLKEAKLKKAKEQKQPSEAVVDCLVGSSS